MKKFFACAIAALALNAVCYAADEPQQRVTQSWHGLTGLYVIPTARMIGRGNLAIGYNESKHVEFVSSSRWSDRQVRGTLTYGITDWLEVNGAYVADQIDIADGFSPNLSNQSFTTFAAKARIFKESGRRPEIAIAVRDITNDMQDIEPLQDVNNGTKFFLLASKKLAARGCKIAPIDVHAGLTKDEQAVSGLFGTEIPISNTVSYIAEGMWDSPFMNFKGIYMNPTHRGTNDHEGRFVFDTGFRLYPEQVPGMTIDFGVVADGQAEFSFGFGYVTKL